VQKVSEAQPEEGGSQQMKKHMSLYDDAAKVYANNCRHGVSNRAWKKRMRWLDQKLAELGETYMEKVEEAS